MKLTDFCDALNLHILMVYSPEQRENKWSCCLSFGGLPSEGGTTVHTADERSESTLNGCGNTPAAALHQLSQTMQGKHLLLVVKDRKEKDKAVSTLLKAPDHLDHTL